MSFERRKIRIGRVVSDRMDQTVVVLVGRRRPHPLYRKSIRRRSRFNAHDENNTVRVGDLVRIIETRPLSKTKRWRVVEVLAREEIAEIQPEEISVGVPDAAAVAPADAGAEAEARGADVKEQVSTEVEQEETAEAVATEVEGAAVAPADAGAEAEARGADVKEQASTEVEQEETAEAVATEAEEAADSLVVPESAEHSSQSQASLDGGQDNGEEEADER